MTAEERREFFAREDADRDAEQAALAEYYESIIWIDADHKEFDPPIQPDTTPDPEGDRE